MNTYIPGSGHFEFYARWPTEIDNDLFAIVFETLTPMSTMDNATFEKTWHRVHDSSEFPLRYSRLRVSTDKKGTYALSQQSR